MVPLSTDTMPVGISSTSHLDRPEQRRSSAPARAAGPRARPGCTRYQWPSSMASVTAPRKAAPTTRARHRQPGRRRRRRCRRRPGRPAPITGATRSSTGGNSAHGRCRTAARRGRCRSWPPPGRVGARPAPARRPRRPAAARPTPPGRPPWPAPPRTRGERRAPGPAPTDPGHDQRRQRHQPIDAPQQPAVADARPRAGGS